MLYMVVEHFAGGDPRPVYARFRERGRMAPAGVEYRGSWVTKDLSLCYQLMESDDRALLDEWASHWADLAELEIIEVMTSPEAVEAVAGLDSS